MRWKMLRKRSAPQRLRMRVSVEWSGSLVEAIPCKPADGKVDLGFAQQAPVVHDAEQETGEHQAQGGFRVDAGSPVVRAVEVRDLAAQPRQIKNAVNAHQNVVVGQELTQRAGDEEFALIAILVAEHADLPGAPGVVNQHSPDLAIEIGVYQQPHPAQAHNAPGGAKRQMMAFVVASSHRWNLPSGDSLSLPRANTRPSQRCQPSGASTTVSPLSGSSSRQSFSLQHHAGYQR